MSTGVILFVWSNRLIQRERSNGKGRARGIPLESIIQIWKHIQQHIQIILFVSALYILHGNIQYMASKTLCTKEQHEEQRATENRPTVFLPQTSRSVVAMEYFRVRITERFSSGMDDNVSSLGQWTMPPSLPKENCPAIQNKPCFDLALCRSTLLLAGQP
jgi:hypothetical protein